MGINLTIWMSYLHMKWSLTRRIATWFLNSSSRMHSLQRVQARGRATVALLLPVHQLRCEKATHTNVAENASITPLACKSVVYKELFLRISYCWYHCLYLQCQRRLLDISLLTFRPSHPQLLPIKQPKNHFQRSDIYPSFQKSKHCIILHVTSGSILYQAVATGDHFACVLPTPLTAWASSSISWKQTDIQCSLLEHTVTTHIHMNHCK